MGLFVFFLAVLWFATPCRTLSVSPAVSVLFVADESSADRSSVRFGFDRNPDAGIFRESHLIDHVAKFWGQFHEWERLLGFLTRNSSMPRLLRLFRLFLGRSVKRTASIRRAQVYLVFAVSTVIIVAFIFAALVAWNNCDVFVVAKQIGQLIEFRVGNDGPFALLRSHCWSGGNGRYVNCWL